MIQAATFAKSVLSKVTGAIMREKSRTGAVKRGLDDIKREMDMVIAEIKSNEEKKQGATHESKIVLLKELACDIEDFIDRPWVPGASSALLSLIGMDPKPEILEKIGYFKTRIGQVREWQPQPDAGSSNGEDSAATWSSCPSPPNPYSQDLDHEDTSGSIRRHKGELGMLLSAAEDKELKVISIVGCRGVGKTSLATAVYHDCRAEAEYDCVAWVMASECRNSVDLLTKLLKEAQRTAKPTSTAAQGSISDSEQTSLRNFLSGKRYFVVIDDVDRLEVWQAIKHEFPKDGHSSRIIVTTSMHSVAAECSWGSHVYTMQCLDQVESEEVFWKSVGKENNKTPALEQASKGIITKCGGLPLALISVANYLRRRGRSEDQVTGGLTTEHCESAACTLGDKILKGQDAEFSEINRALLQCYNNLPDYAHQSCLLYASVFPRGRPIKSKVLLRRWMSEEFAANGTVCHEGVKSCLQAFIERCIIEPVEIKNARVARCKVHSIMLEFIIHKAVSKKFVALLDKDELLPNNGPTTNVRVRRLSVQDSREGDNDAVCTAGNIDLSVIRSLTISESTLLDLQACELLRVLDLEGCNGVNNDTVLQAICKQRFLKYLSLRGTDVEHLHRKIRRLVHLETLDIRDTSVEVVPIEVISLPLLAHLFGQFKLPHGISEEISKQSKLQTLAGVMVTEADKSFENIILHAGKLRKVKICQAKSYSSSSRNRQMNPDIKSPLLRLKERFAGSKALQILSIDSSDLSKEFISFLKAPCAITSIKLRGQLHRLPATPTLSELSNLNRLLLISTGLSIEDLSALQSLPCLEYLKLAEDEHEFRGGSFVVTSGGFPSLRRLCFEAPRLPQVQIEQESMKSLTILDLLCPDPEPHLGNHVRLLQLETRLDVAGVSYLDNLKEVILHHSTREPNVQAWKNEANRHHNKPSVKMQPPPTIHAA